MARVTVEDCIDKVPNRFELGYGYSELDRFGVEGHTQFLQSRLQLTL